MNVIILTLMTIVFTILALVVISLIIYASVFYYVKGNKRNLIKWKQWYSKFLRYFGIEIMKSYRINPMYLQDEAMKTAKELRNIPPAFDDEIADFFYKKYRAIANFNYREGKKDGVTDSSQPINLLKL